MCNGVARSGRVVTVLGWTGPDRRPQRATSQRDSRRAEYLADELAARAAGAAAAIQLYFGCPGLITCVRGRPGK